MSSPGKYLRHFSASMLSTDWLAVEDRPEWRPVLHGHWFARGRLAGGTRGPAAWTLASDVYVESGMPSLGSGDSGTVVEAKRGDC